MSGVPGRFTVIHNGTSAQASIVVLAPADRAEQDEITLRSGLFLCPPSANPEVMGAAMAAKVGAAMGGGRVVAPRNIAQVDPVLCRGCGTCEAVCQHNAIHVVEKDGRWGAQVEPLLCQGGGTCVAHCPSSAITAGYSTDRQIEAMLEAILVS